MARVVQIVSPQIVPPQDDMEEELEDQPLTDLGQATGSATSPVTDVLEMEDTTIDRSWAGH